MKNIKENFNEILLAYYIFSYVLLKRIIPNYENVSTLILTINVVFVLSSSLLYNKFKVKFSIKELIIYLVIILYALIDYNFRSNEFTTEIYTYMIIFAIIPIFLYMRIKKLDVFINSFAFFSAIVALLYLLDPFQNYEYSGDYMTFGYSIMMLAYIGLYTKIRQKKSILLTLLCILVLAEIVIFANKGAILSVALYTLLYELLINKNTMKKFLLIIVGMMILLSFTTIVEKVYEFANKNNIDSYSIVTLYQVVKGNSSGLSGREEIWVKAEEELEKNILLGNGAGYYRTTNNGIYSHNLVFDVLIEYGIIIFIIMFVVILKGVWKISNVKGKNRLISIIFLAMWFPKLFFSSYFQSEMGFWLFIIWALLDEKVLIGEENE